MRSCDVAVVGLGIMGSAALYNLARRKVDAIGFDAVSPGHGGRSSHGTSRIYRRYNFENPAYTALSEHAFAAWRRLEDASGAVVLKPTALVEAGPPGSIIVSGTLSAAGPDGPSLIRGGEVNRLFAAFDVPGHWDAVVQTDAGILLAEAALSLYRAGAADRVVNQNVRLKVRPCLTASSFLLLPSPNISPPP